MPQKPPTPISLGAGEKPNVLVDAAGTAHIVWNEPGGDADKPDQTRYCRLERGATACDATAALVPDQPYGGGNAARFNDDTAGPRVLALGDELVVLSYRYPNVVPKPDGASSRTLYAWTSDDGGSTFSAPAIVGNQEPSGGAIVFGTDADPRIGVISDTQTGGTFFQQIRPGQYDGRRANLAGPDGDRAYSGSLATEGGQPVAAFADLQNRIFVRRLPVGGDPADATPWTNEAPLTGTEPRLAGGPAGTFLMSKTDRGQYVVTDLTPGQPPSPTRVSDTPDAGYRDLYQDPAGKLFASWVDRTTKEVDVRTSTNGTRFSGAHQVLFRGTEDPAALDLAATADGGGFGVVEAAGQVFAAAMGTGQKTGVPGLGTLGGGGGGDTSATVGCTKVAFGTVDITPMGGCLLGSADPKFAGAKVANDTIDLNGLQIVPDAGVKIVINGRQHTIDTTGQVRVLLRASGVGEIVLWHGELHVKLPTAGAGTKLFSFDTSTFAAALKGFPIKGKIDVELLPDSVRIPVALGLPKVFGDIRGDAVLLADKQRGLHVDSLLIAVDKAFIGPLLLDHLRLEYQSSLDEWNGELKVGLPPQPGGAAIDGTMRFRGGAFQEATLGFTPPFPGVAAGPGVFITYVGGGFGIEPITITAKASFGAIPIPPGSYTLGVDGQLKVVFAEPTTFTLDGTGRLFGFPIASAQATANTDGFFSARGNVELDLTLVSVGGSFQGFVDGPKGLFGGEGSGNVKIFGYPAVEGTFVLSSNGVGGCYSLLGADLGFGYHWGDSLPFGVNVMLLTCDLEPYKLANPGPRGAGARFAAVTPGAAVFTVAAGEPSHQLEVDAAAGAPGVVLVSPTGERIVPVAAGSAESAGAKAIAMAQGDANRSIVAVRAPAAGTWSVEPAAGSPAFTTVRSAAAATAPTVTARIGGRGRARTLTYAIRGGTSDLRVTFAERGAAGTKVIGVAKGRTGTVRFGPADGPGGRRDVLALLQNGEMPRGRPVVARYVAPGPLRPGRVAGVKVRRAGRALAVRWARIAGAASYAVRVTVSDGRRELRLAPARATTLRIGLGLTRADRATVTVTARSAGGRSGRPSRPASVGK